MPNSGTYTYDTASTADDIRREDLAAVDAAVANVNNATKAWYRAYALNALDGALAICAATDALFDIEEDGREAVYERFGVSLDLANPVHGVTRITRGGEEFWSVA